MTSSKLGIDNQTGETVYLHKSSRRQGTYFIAAPGVGKSTSLRHLIEQDIKQGIGVCVFDPHGDLIDEVIGSLHRREDRERVLLLDAQDQNRVFGINLYQCDNPTDKITVENTVERVRHLFELLWSDIGKQPLVSQGIRNSSYAFIDSSPAYGCTMLELSMLFTEKTPRANIVAHLRDTMISAWWNRFEGFDDTKKAERYDMVVNKIEEYTSSRLLQPIIGQSKSTIDFREVIDSTDGKIVLVKMYGDNERMTQLIGSMVIAQILNAALSRQDTEKEKRRQFHIYADEFELYATEDFTRLLKECRKYGIGVTLAHQSREGISNRNKAASLQVANIISGRIIPDDAKDIVEQFKAEPQELPGHFRPGRVRHEQVMEEEMEEYVTEGWTYRTLADDEIYSSSDLSPEEAKRQYDEAAKKLYDLETNHRTELLKAEVLIETLIADTDSASRLYLYRVFNPNYLEFFQRPDSILLSPSLQELALYNAEENERFYRLTDPLQVMSPAEMGLTALSNLQPKPLTAHYSVPLTKEEKKKKQYAQYLLSNIKPLLVQYRQDAVYRGVPALELPTHRDKLEWQLLEEYKKEHKVSYFFSSNELFVDLPNLTFGFEPHKTLRKQIRREARRQVDANYQKMREWKERLEQNGYMHYSIQTTKHVTIDGSTFGLSEHEDWYWKIQEYPDVLYFLDAEAQQVVPTYRLAQSLRSEMEELKEKYWNKVRKLRPTGRMVPVYERTSSGFGRSARTERSPVYVEVQEPGEYIPGGWESQTDARAKVVNELTHLDDYIAKMRIKNAEGKLEEHVIKLATSSTRLEDKIYVEQWIEDIKERMLDKGYLRSITDVEKEISERHALLRQPPKPSEPVLLPLDKPVEPPSPPRRMKICPKCQAPNPQAAKFCHQCATPMSQPSLLSPQPMKQAQSKKPVAVAPAPTMLDVTPALQPTPDLELEKLIMRFQRYEKHLKYHVQSLVPDRKAIDDPDLELPIPLRLADLKSDPHALAEYVRKNMDQCHKFAARLTGKPIKDIEGKDALFLAQYTFAVRVGQRLLGIPKDQLFPWHPLMQQLLAYVKNFDLQRLVQEDMA